MVLAALRAHRNNEAVLISGVALLACLAHGDDSTKEVIVAHDGIKAIVTAMKENAGAFRVTVGACAAISTIAAATDGGSSQAKRAVFESGAMTQVLHALQVFSQPKVHAECAGAVANVVAGETGMATPFTATGFLLWCCVDVYRHQVSRKLCVILLPCFSRHSVGNCR